MISFMSLHSFRFQDRTIWQPLCNQINRYRSRVGRACPANDIFRTKTEPPGIQSGLLNVTLYHWPIVKIRFLRLVDAGKMEYAANHLFYDPRCLKPQVEIVCNYFLIWQRPCDCLLILRSIDQLDELLGCRDAMRVHEIVVVSVGPPPDPNPDL